MASLPGAIVSLVPSYPPWSEYKEGLSFEAWMKRIFKTQGDSMAQAIKNLLAEPEKMKQDDEMVVAFSRREGPPRKLPHEARIGECGKTCQTR